MKTRNNAYFLLLLVCLFSACEYSDNNPEFLLETVFADNDERLLNYNAVNDAQREPFFIEEFDDNVSEFPYQIGTYNNGEVSIVDGKMTVNFFENNAYIYSQPVPIEMDKSRNFEMETSLIIYRGDSVHTFAWLPNQLESGNKYAIVYEQIEDSENKKNKITEAIFMLWSPTDDWKIILGYDIYAKSFLNSDEFTVLTIRKIGNKYAIFINYKLFYIINDKNFSYIPAITIDESVINVFDYFRVYYLP